MPKIQACRNQCGTQIFVKEDTDGKFKPYDANTNELHDCPNSEWNKKKQQGESYRTPKESTISDIDAKILDTLEKLSTDNEKILKMLESFYSGRAFQDQELEE